MSDNNLSLNFVKMFFQKESAKKALCSFVFNSCIGDMYINGILVDFNSHKDIVKSIQYDGNPVISGEFFANMKSYIIEVFNNMTELSPGLYEFDGNIIKKV